MILLHISSADTNLLHEVAIFLVNEKLAYDVQILSGQRIRLHENQALTENSGLLKARTRALLWKKIEQTLNEKFGEPALDLWSIPIVNMEAHHAEELMTVLTTDL